MFFKEVKKDLIEFKVTENSLFDPTAKLITEYETIRFKDKSIVKSKPFRKRRGREDWKEMKR